MSYFLSPALVTLRAQINAMFPLRDKTSDGWIGDTSHQARKSDHNPDYGNGGIVRALDIDEDLWGKNARDPGAIAQALADILTTDPRVAYVIYEGRIWQNPAVFANGGWRRYTGVNAHRLHVHVSIRHGARWDRDGSQWRLPGAPGTPATPPGGVKRPASAVQLEMLDFLGFGSTVAYQRDRALHPDGDMGPITATALTKEYEMTAARIETKVDQLAAAVARLAGQSVKGDVTAALTSPIDGRPDGLARTANQIKDKLARQDLVYMLFETEDGRKGVQIVATREWMIAPDEDTLRRFLDVLMFQGFAHRNDPWGPIRDWWYVRGLPQGTPVQNLYALGREVEWRPADEPELAPEDVATVTEPEVDVEPVPEEG